MVELFSDAKAIILNPVTFFRTTTKPIHTSLLSMLILTGFQALLSLPFASTFYQIWDGIFGALTGKILPQLGYTTTFFAILFGILIITFMLIIMLACTILHTCFKIFGASTSPFADTLMAVVFGLTPTYLFGWIPYLSLLTYLWSIILIAIGLYTKHQLGMFRFILITTAIILFIAAAILYTLGY